VKIKIGSVLLVYHMACIFGWPLCLNGAKYAVNRKYIRKIYLIEKYLNYLNYLIKKVRNYSLFDKFLNHYFNPSLVRTRLSDHTKQTKFQSQRPNNVETPVPSI
jgi:hypothetical protein